MERTRHDHEGHDDLGDHVEDGVGAHLEGNGERGETLREEPHNRVARPHEDGHPAHLACKVRSSQKEKARAEKLSHRLTC